MPAGQGLPRLVVGRCLRAAADAAPRLLALLLPPLRSGGIADPDGIGQGFAGAALRERVCGFHGAPEKENPPKRVSQRSGVTQRMKVSAWTALMALP